jgi:chemotaxis protein methyltransferase CheR
MYFPSSRKNYLEQKIFKRMTNYNIQRFADYFHILSNELIKTEIIQLFNEITVNETFFFRDLPQLDAFRLHIVPEMIAAGKKRLSILSAGCSSGEEAYTLAMIMRENFPTLPFTINGIDISEKVIAKAQRAEYTDYAVRFVPEPLQKKYFAVEDGVYIVKKEGVMDTVSFKKTNLVEFADDTTMAGYDIIFCRYVPIYFDTDSKRKVISGFYNKLAKKGYLILGNSESLFAVSNDFTMLHFPSAIIYKKEI